MRITDRLKTSGDDFLGPVEKIEHDAHVDSVCHEGYAAALEFVRACCAVGKWKLKNRELSGDAGYYVEELAKELVECIAEFIAAGDVEMARRLPPISATMQR